MSTRPNGQRATPSARQSETVRSWPCIRPLSSPMTKAKKTRSWHRVRRCNRQKRQS